MDVAEFDYDLPQELIAQKPLESRDLSRLMVVDRHRKTITHKTFKDILDYLNPSDCMVINNARVLPARLHGKKTDTGGKVELLLLSEVEPGMWEVLVKPGRRLSAGTVVTFDEESLTAAIEKRLSGGKRLASFHYQGDFTEILRRVGEVPLPPYIRMQLDDPDRYQTVFASKYGAVAAPTAGLHFTEELLDEVKNRRITYVPITLDVGLDSFRPVRVIHVEEHKMHGEKMCISKHSARAINNRLRQGGKVLAVGTTVARVLEAVATKDQQLGWKTKPWNGKTDLFIYPGYAFKIVDMLLTNFHLPKSTLLMLVCAFASKELVMEAYRQAVEQKYRFFSFGDAMLII